MEQEELQLSERERAEAKERQEKKLAAEITADFERRREERRSVESGWLLNLNFYSGNQYCDISPFGGLAEFERSRLFGRGRGFESGKACNRDF